MTKNQRLAEMAQRGVITSRAAILFGHGIRGKNLRAVNRVNRRLREAEIVDAKRAAEVAAELERERMEQEVVEAAALRERQLASGYWECPSCKALTIPGSSYCSGCRKRRPPTAEEIEAAKSSSWQCQSCAELNPKSERYCSTEKCPGINSEMRLGQNDNWRCPDCGSSPCYPSEPNCFNCKKPRPAGYYKQ